MLSTEILKLLAIPVILGVLIFGFICTGMTSHTSMRGDRNTVMVTSMSRQECCATSISKNFDLWKGTLLVLSRDTSDILMLLALGLVMILAFVRPPIQYSADYVPNSYRFYERDNLNLPIFNYLKLAFARGILNSKIY